jgi:hypothetical protein
VSVGLGVEELAEFLNVDEVSIDAHTKAKWSVHFEGQPMLNKQRGVVRRHTVKGLRFASVMSEIVSKCARDLRVLEVFHTQRSFQQSGISGGRCRGFQAIVEGGLRHS